MSDVNETRTRLRPGRQRERTTPPSTRYTVTRAPFGWELRNNGERVGWFAERRLAEACKRALNERDVK